MAYISKYTGEQVEDALDSAVQHDLKRNNPHEVTKAQVGLGAVDNTSDLDKPISTATKAELDKKVDKSGDANLVPTSKVNAYDQHLVNTQNPHAVTKEQVGLGNLTNDAQIKRSEMGVANGVATLDTNGHVPASQLPSYVDDVLEKETIDKFPTEGESGKVYIDTTTNITYRWGGTKYVPIGSDLALGETESSAYSGAKGKANAEAIALLNGTVEQSGSVKQQIAAESTVLKNGVIKAAKDAADAAQADITTHKNNGDIHVTQSDKNTWNAKQNAINESNKLPYSLISGTPSIPTTLPASNVTDTYSPTGSDPVSGKAVASAISGKQNTIDASNPLAASKVSGLATVATSGSYNDLSNKPTIPTTLPASGGNADTVDNYHFVVGSSAGTAANTIYFVV